MRIKFLQSGESPYIGVFDAGLEREVLSEFGQVFIERGLAEEIEPEKRAVIIAEEDE